MKSDEGWPPPAAMAVVLAAWTPGPVVVVVDPAAVVIGCPAPRFISHPRPAIRWTPRPITMTVRCPVRVIVNNRCVWSPDPTIVVDVRPRSVSVEVFRAPDVTVIVLVVVAHPLRQVIFSIVNPAVP